jgi:photosystem II stability/assembly factor-like uncharacterized protein
MITTSPLPRLISSATKLACVAFGLASTLHAQWTPSSGPLGPDLRALFLDAGTLYAGTSVGVFTTTPTGTTWTEMNSGMAPFVTVQCFTRSGANLLAGTSAGLFLSTNSGATWRAIDLGSPAPSLLSFLAVGPSLFVSGNSGVFVSSDNGLTWAARRTGLPTGAVRVLIANDSMLLAGTVGGGVYISTNNGASWTASSTGLTNLIIRGLAVHAGRIFATTLGGGVFVSSDNGATWVEKNRGITFKEVVAIATDGVNVFVGTNGAGILVTTDAGENWVPVNTGLAFNIIFALTVSGNAVYAGAAGGGVYRSTNAGASWTSVGGSAVPGKAAVLSMSSSPGLLIAGSAAGGIYTSANGGATWINALSNRSIRYVDPFGTSLIAATNDSIYASADNGLTWRKTGDAGLTNLVVFSQAVIGTRIFAGTAGSGVFMSTDGGASWVPRNTPALSTAVVARMAALGTTLFIGTNSTGAYRSLDLGATWTLMSIGPPNTNVSEFAVSNNNVFASTASGLFISTNNGATWAAVPGTGLPAPNVGSLLAYGSDLFASTASGLFVTRNNGATWTAVNTGWTSRINAIGISDNLIALGTDFGVLTRPLAEVVGSHLLTAESPQVANVSSRAVVAPGNPLIVGFVVTGNAPKRLLVRGVGPGLGAFGVAGALADPRLDIFRSGVGTDAPIAAVDNWSDAPNDSAQIAATAASVGAFPLEPASRDAAMVGTFSPGAYTVQVSAAGTASTASGVALIEIYGLK